MNQFFVTAEQIGNDTIRIEGTDVNHIKNVLRMSPGEEIKVCDSEHKIEYRCQIAALEEDCVLADILWQQEADTELPNKIYLFQGLPKSDKMEWIIQKTVELGIYEIIPVATRRAVVKLDAKKAAAKEKRWNSISESAAKQSKRIQIPRINHVMTFLEALEYAKALDVCLIPYERAENMEETRTQMARIKQGQSIGIFIGPEGGFDPEEVAAAQNMGAVSVTLGRRILRTETAGMALLSALMFQLEP